MKLFTVIGFYCDNGQPYAGHRRAKAAHAACAAAPAGVHVVAVIKGMHTVLADDGYVGV